MQRSRWIAAGALALAALGAGTGVAVAGPGTDPTDPDRDVPIAGTDLEQASAAALEATGGGRVTETEVGDEESHYEVEVTLPDGGQVDVQLDASFAVVGREADGADDEGAED